MNKFEVLIDSKVLKGIEFNVNNPKANLLVITGMDEHSSRYAPFALELNKSNISVSILDHFGQGENVSDLKDLQKVPHNSCRFRREAAAHLFFFSLLLSS